MTRKVFYVTGTRADFGLMRATLSAIEACDELELSLLVTGMHLSTRYGKTVEEIQEAGFEIAKRVDTQTHSHGGGAMAKGIARMVEGFTEALEEGQPDLVLLLGDRGEMLAGAIAAIHLDLPIVHIHGGERSGTVDEPVRHAISKLSHFHFAATPDAAHRLVGMGEHEDRVHVVGAPGLVGLEEQAKFPRAVLGELFDLDPKQAIALFLFHPVLQDSDENALHVRNALNAISEYDMQVVALQPNSDAGNEGVRAELAKATENPRFRLLTHLPREQFVSLMATSDILIGNSSSGIIEAATFGTPVVNIGTRQNLRERNANTIDVGTAITEISRGVSDALDRGRCSVKNVYGDGSSDQRICELLQRMPLTNATRKTLAY